MRVKICGIARLEDALAAAGAGADVVGCLVGLDHPSDDSIGSAAARDIFAALPPFVVRVLVTHRTTTAEVLALVRESAPMAVQLHGAFPLDSVAELRRAVPHLAIVKNVHVDGEQAVERARSAAEVADAVLLDSRTADRIGGTGVAHDWSISARIVREIARPVILAGGLHPGNVGEAIARVSPYAVDVNSGTKDPDGTKSHDRIRAFVAAAKRAGGMSRQRPGGIR
jgi:phosphoribosylanthranilate isomerase